MFDEIDDVFDEGADDNGIWSDMLGGDSDEWGRVDHGLNKQDFTELFEKVHPTASQWKDGPDSRHDDVYVTVNEGCHKMWLQGKKEIEFVRKKLKGLFI